MNGDGFGASRRVDYECQSIVENEKIGCWLIRHTAILKWADTLRTEYGIKIVTPRRQKKGDTLKSGDAYSTAVSLRRQPADSNKCRPVKNHKMNSD